MLQRWLGYLRGSRTGTLFMEVSESGMPLLAIGLAGGADLRLRVDRESGATEARLLDEQDSVYGTIKIESETETKLSGAWKFVSGAQGVFNLDLAPSAEPSTPQATNEKRIWNRELPIGAVTLYRSDLERLLSEMRSLIERPCETYVRAKEGDNTIVETSDQYLVRKNYIDVVRVMTISAEELTDQPLKRVLILNLNDDGSSQMSVTSTEEIWTTAAAIRLEIFLRQFTSKVAGWLRRHGLNINGFILLAVLIWMPDRPLLQRIAVLVVAVIVIAVILRSHRLLPYNRVYLSPDREKRPFAREIPAVTMAAIAALVIGALSSFPKAVEVLKTFLTNF